MVAEAAVKSVAAGTELVPKRFKADTNLIANQPIELYVNSGDKHPIGRSSLQNEERVSIGFIRDGEPEFGAETERVSEVEGFEVRKLDCGTMSSNV